MTDRQKPTGKARKRAAAMNADATVAATPRAKPMGRPSGFTPELWDEICARIAEGKSFRTICRDDAMPGLRTVITWLREKPEIQRQYVCARDAQADAYFEESFEIADKATPEMAQIARLRVDLRKWAAARLAPKRYGERITQEHVGAEGGPVAIARPLCPDEVAEQIQKMLAENERELGLVPAPDASDGERLRQILATEQPVTPALFSAVRGSDKRFPWKDSQ